MATVDLSSLAGKTVSVIALNFKSTTQQAYELTLGQLGILPANYAPASTQISNLTILNELTQDGGDIRAVWDASTSKDVHHYNVYMTRNGEKKLVGQTRNEGFYISKFVRTSIEEKSVTVAVTAVTNDLKEGNEITTIVEYPALDKPVVSLKASKTLLNAGEEITITANATNFPESYQWTIPENAEKPERSNKKKEQPITLLDILKEQKVSKYSGGIYHKTQIDLTYNSNHIEGSSLTHDQTRYIFETNTIGVEKDVLNVDDVIETANHFRCIDMIIDNAKAVLTEKFIKELHLILKSGTSDSRKDWFAVGDYKKMPNEVGGMETALPEEVADKMKALLTEYNGKEEKTFEDILDFHVKFERIHPFQDGNGRVGRLIMFKECLKYNIVPFIIEDNLKMFYYRGLKEWNNEKGYLTDTCLTAQDKYKAYLDYFRIVY